MDLTPDTASVDATVAPPVGDLPAPEWTLEAPLPEPKRRRRKAKRFTNKPPTHVHMGRGGAHTPYRRPRVNVEVVDAFIRSNRIKEFLMAKGITQEEMSRRVGTSYRHANRIALGKSHPSLLLAHRIAAVLGEPTEHVFQVEVETRRAHRGGSRLRTYTPSW